MDFVEIIGVSMQSDLQRIQTVSQNIANVLTPGYKRTINIDRGFQMYFDGAQLEAAVDSTNKSSRLLDQTAGAMRYTSNPNDLAIDGVEFFEINTPTGVAYTRQASLKVDLQGRLVGSQELPVMGVGGEITLANQPFSVAQNGDVQQHDRVIGRLRRVHIEHASEMVPQGAGLYGAGTAMVVDVDSGAAVRAGFQEASNTNSANEMVALTETVRHFEALQKLVQWRDDSLGQTIRKLGEF